MEETLGKRIVNHRKSLGMTQDQLAERLGVTAQAVSKWENDQSCPDITMLPRLAQIFGTTTDALLGLNSQPKAPEDEIVEIPDTEISAEPGTFQLQGDNGNWEFHWDGGRKSDMCHKHRLQQDEHKRQVRYRKTTSHFNCPLALFEVAQSGCASSRSTNSTLSTSMPFPRNSSLTLSASPFSTYIFSMGQPRKASALTLVRLFGIEPLWTP